MAVSVPVLPPPQAEALAAAYGRAVASRRMRTLLVLFAILILALAAGTAIVAATGLPPAGTRNVLRTSTVQPFEPRNYAKRCTRVNHR